MFWLGTSWKMNKTRPQAADFVATLAQARLPAPPQAQLFLVPPFTAIETVKARAAGLPLLVGAQNVHDAESGAFTGEVSAVMLAELDCDLVEIGHSERRQMFGETDEAVNAKVHAVLAQGLRPLVCIGETAAERRLDAAIDTVRRQARMALAGVAPTARRDCLLAYEPVWAIGEGGEAAAPAVVAAVHRALKQDFPDSPLLYGGSVSPDNCAAFAARAEVDGLFIGRSAWQPEGFLDIVARSLAARRQDALAHDDPAHDAPAHDVSEQVRP